MRRHQQSDSTSRTALVLGGGGPQGIAWEAGLLHGLLDGGIDLARADRIIGTSAGSIVGTHLAVRGSVEELYNSQATPLGSAIKPPRMAPLLLALAKAKLFSRNVRSERRLLGKSARAANLQGEQEWLSGIAGFLPHAGPSVITTWPKVDLVITAVDAESGELVTWTRESSVPLSTAVASSCAVPCVYPLVHIDGHVYMDGGMGSPTNANLANGYDLVVIADPLARLMGKLSPMLREKAELSKQGSCVLAFAFDDDTARLTGFNLMDVSKRASIAELARAHGRAAAVQWLAQPDVAKLVRPLLQIA